MEEPVKKEGVLREEYRDKRYHIVGIGKSGVGAANLLNSLGAKVSLSDRNSAESLGDFLPDIHTGVAVYPKRQDPDLLSGIDCLVLSPGVPPDMEMAGKAKEAGIEVMGEIELAYRVIRRLSLERGFPVRWFGITGTNGKSTTTALLYELMKKGKKRCLLAGNIGISLSGEALKLMERGTAFPDIDIVLELSSFQLETMKEFRLDGSALLNITDDHMDRYQDLSAYGEAKASIFINQGPENFAVINADDENAIHYSANCRARKYFVSAEKEVEGFFASGGNIFFKSGNGTRVFGGTADVSMLGLHNLYNAMTSSLMAYLAGIPSEAIISALREFPGLEHRIEFSGETQGVKFYNDSKGTNVGAVIKSLESFDRGVILIAGGRDKNSDFTVLNPYLKKRAKKAVLIGEAADKIAKAIGNTVPVEKAASLRDAVIAAYRAAGTGDTVLLSPACASFDMFRNYEDRGRQFKEIVRNLIGEKERGRAW